MTNKTVGLVQSTVVLRINFCECSKKSGPIEVAASGKRVGKLIFTPRSSKRCRKAGRAILSTDALMHLYGVFIRFFGEVERLNGGRLFPGLAAPSGQRQPETEDERKSQNEGPDVWQRRKHAPE